MGGKWYSTDFYRPHPREDLDVVLNENTMCLKAIKLTGDRNVPAGNWSWRTCQPLKVGDCVEGALQLRDDAWNPWGFYEKGITIRARSLDHIFIEWGSHCGNFYRIQEAKDDTPSNAGRQVLKAALSP